MLEIEIMQKTPHALVVVLCYSQAMNATFSTPLVIGNWKSHKNWDEVETWLKEFTKADVKPTGTVAIAPAFPFLEYVADEIEEHDLPIDLAVQDLSQFPAGAYTGSVSTANLEGLMVRFAILGHSERRRYFHETNQEVANKVEQALAAGIVPVVCVDEPYQMAQAAALSPEVAAKCVVAYEPVEAIGSGLPQSVDEVVEVINKIKKTWGDVPVIYGGSVDVKNVSTYLSACQGVLVATHSLDATEFAAIVSAAN